MQEEEIIRRNNNLNYMNNKISDIEVCVYMILRHLTTEEKLTIQEIREIKQRLNIS